MSRLLDLYHGSEPGPRARRVLDAIARLCDLYDAGLARQRAAGMVSGHRTELEYRSWAGPRYRGTLMAGMLLERWLHGPGLVSFAPNCRHWDVRGAVEAYFGARGHDGNGVPIRPWPRPDSPRPPWQPSRPGRHQ